MSCFTFLNSIYFRWVHALFVWTFMFFAYCIYVVAFCFGIVDSLNERLAYLIPFHVFLFFVLWTMVQTVIVPNVGPSDYFTIPDHICEEMRVASKTTLKEFNLVLERFVKDQKIILVSRSADDGGRNHAVRYCHLCVCMKPYRCHHCSSCARCILRFDHHCPWLNSCVGFKNYKFFVLFIGYSSALSVFILSTIFSYFISFWQHHDSEKHIICRFLVSFLFVVLFLLSIALNGFLICHLLLISKNQTSLEYMVGSPVFAHGRDKHGFDLGVRRNFQEVFGTTKWKWLLPLFSSQGDGIISTRANPAVIEKISE